MLKTHIQSLNKLASHLEEWKDQISGGLADNRKPQEFDPVQLAKGVWVEREHTNDFKVAMEIAMDHLTEDPKYYSHLEHCEKD